MHFRAENGFPPTRPEIAKALGLAHYSAVNWHLSALQNKGLVEVIPNTQRGLRLLDEDLAVVPLGPIGATASVTDKHRIVARMPTPVAEQFNPYPTYFVTVLDIAMVRSGLHPGDRVAVKEQDEPEPEDGQVVLARVDGNLVLRRYRKANAGHVELRAESTSRLHRTITSDPAGNAFRIEGVMVGALIGAHPV